MYYAFYENKEFSEFDIALHCKKCFNEYELPRVIVTNSKLFIHSFSPLVFKVCCPYLI